MHTGYIAGIKVVKMRETKSETESSCFLSYLFIMHIVAYTYLIFAFGVIKSIPEEDNLLYGIQLPSKIEMLLFIISAFIAIFELIIYDYANKKCKKEVDKE